MSPEKKKMISRKLIIILATLSVSISNTIFTIPSKGHEENRTLPGLPCKIDPLEEPELKKLKWTDQEYWVWKQVCEGKKADLKIYIKQKKPDFYNDNFPLETKKIDELRILTSDFLRTILLYEPFHSAITEKGVIISGAWFQERVVLSSGKLNEDLSLWDSRFDNSAELGLVHSQYLLSMDGSYFRGEEVNINGGVVGGSLFMRDVTFETDIDLIAVKVNGDLDFSGSYFRGEKVNVGGAVVGGNLFMSDATFETDINLTGVKVNRTLDFNGSYFRGEEVNINSGVVGGSLFMSDATFETDIDLTGVKVNGDLAFNGSYFRGEKVNINSGVVEGSLFMRDVTFETDIYLIAVKINGTLDFSGSYFRGEEVNIDSGVVGANLFMRDATFETDIYLTNVKVNYLELGDITIEGSLYLTSTEVNNFQIYNSLPIVDSVNITNFTYNQLNNNSVEFLKNTLDKLEYIPQPYEQFAKVTRQIGLQNEGEDMLFKSKDKELMQELKKWNLAPVLGLLIQRVIIGYGYKIEYSFYLSLLFLTLGWYQKIQESKRAKEVGIDSLVNNIKPAILLSLFININYLHLAFILFLRNFEIGIGRSFLYSLDTLLPVIVLDEKHKDIPISKSTRNYFYFLKLWGYLVVVLLLPLLFR